MADYLRHAMATAKNVHQLSFQGASVKINMFQCRQLSEMLSKCISHLLYQAESCLLPSSKYQNELLCKQIYQIAVDVESLVRDCCEKKWLKTAILLGNSKIAFSLKACELEWCNTLLCMIMQASTLSDPMQGDAQMRRVEEAVAACELKIDGIMRAVEAAAVQDQERLRSKLMGVRDSGSEGSYVAKYLLQRMSGFEKHNSGIAMWEVKPKDLKEVARLRMGQYGITYEATWMKDKYAVKVFAGIKDERSFRHETSAFTGLWHPHIVPMLCCAINMDEGECSLVMELMSEDLYSFMRRRMYITRTVPFTLFAAIDTMLQIAEGMEYLHNKKIPHRDLNSSNILVNPVTLPELAADGYVHAKVADFSLAKTKGASATYAHQSHLSGTLLWMAPEVFSVHKHVRENPGTTGFLRQYLKADVYSYGMICYQILTGKVPFVDEKYSKLFERVKVHGARPDLPPTCPTSLASLIRRCWDGDARLRPSFSKICKELRHLRSILMTGDALDLQGLKYTFPRTDSTIEEVKSDSSDTDTFKCTLEKVKQLTSPETLQSLQLNTDQCRHLLEHLQKTVTDIDKEIKQLAPVDEAFCEQQGKLALGELHRIVKDAESLINDCCNEQWLNAAIMLADSKEVFAKSLLQLQWCASVIRINIVQVKTGVEVAHVVEENLKIAMAECERKVELMYVTNKEFAKKDQEVLRQKLKLVMQGESKCDRYLARFLLGRLGGFRQDDRDQQEPYYLWIVEPKELVQGQRLGHGACGTVYETTWLGMPYACKTFPGAGNPSFRQEATMLVGLTFHPQVVPMICCSVNKEGSCSLVMERMSEDLSSSMNALQNSSEGPPFELHVAVDIMLQIAEGMHFLHSNRVVHRDLKSSNVLVSADDKGYMRVKVADFGLAKTKAISCTYTQQSLGIGTTRWMAPELYKPQNHLQKRGRSSKVDVYSYAMTCLEILTGKVPFYDEISITALREKVKAGFRPTLPPTCPRRLAALIRSCWNKDPSKRPAFQDICRELRHQKGLLLIGGETLLQSLDSLPESQPQDVPEVAGQTTQAGQGLRCADAKWNQRYGRSMSFQNPVREMAKSLGCGLLLHSLSIGSYLE